MHPFRRLASRSNGEEIEHMGQEAPAARPYAVYVCAILSAAIIAGTWRAYLLDMETAGAWSCTMSWMTPRYIKQNGPSVLDSTALKHYGLYLYREDGWDLKDSPSGFPVIFVPGNAGSMKQCRSIAASASKQYYVHPGHRSQIWDDGGDSAGPLDIFAIDFVEELSAIDSATLWRQADYLSRCVAFVLSQYDHLPVTDRPQQVALVGHSMGGVVARLACALDQHLLARRGISIILTLSTPHREPPFKLGKGMSFLYRHIDTFWSSRHSAGLYLPNVVSICGGVPDSQLPSEICALPSGSLNGSRDFTVFTTGIPGVWTGVEHQAIVWCHQVRWIVAKLLLLARRSTHEQFSGIAERLLLDSHVTKAPASATLSPELQVYGEMVQRIITSDQPITHLLPINDGVRQVSLLCSFPIEDFGSQESMPVGIQACLENQMETCSARHASIRVSWIAAPSSGNNVQGEAGLTKSGLLHISVTPHLKQEHWYLSITTPGTGWVLLQDDQHEEAHASSFGRVRHVYTQRPAQHTTTVQLRDLVLNPLLAYSFKPLSPTCERKSTPLLLPTLRFTSSNTLARVFEQRFFPVQGAIPIHSHASMSNDASNSEANAIITVFQDPDDVCATTGFELQIDWQGTAAKCVLRLRILFVAWPLGVLLLVLQRQLQRQGQTLTPETMAMSLDHCLRRQASLLAITLPIAAVITGTESIGLGTKAIILSPLSIPAMILSATAAAGLAGLPWLLKRLRSPWIKSNDTASLKRESQIRNAWITFALLILLGASCVPQQMVQLMAICWMWASTRPCAQHAPHTPLHNTVRIMALLLIPFHGPALVSWVIAALRELTPFVPADHQVHHALPVIIFACFAGSRALPPRHVHLTYLRGAAALGSLWALAAGVNQPEWIPLVIDCFFLMTAFI